MNITDFLVGRTIDKSILKDDRSFVDYTDAKACGEIVSNWVSSPEDTIRVAYIRHKGDNPDFPEKFCIVLHGAVSGLPEDMILASVGKVIRSPTEDLGAICEYGALGYRFSTDTVHPVITNAPKCEEVGNTEDLTNMVNLFAEVVRYTIQFAPFLGRCLVDGTLDAYLESGLQEEVMH